MHDKDSRELQATIRAAQNGDERAFEQLLDVVERPAYRLAFSMLGNEQDAEDACQQVLIKLWRTLPAYRLDCPILPYVLRMTRNTVLDMKRRTKVERERTVSLTVRGEDGEEVTPDVPDTDEGSQPPLAYERQERIQAVRRAIDELSPDAREILMLKDIHGYSYESIGHILSIGEGTVKSRLFRARKKLAERLKEWNIF